MSYYLNNSAHMVVTGATGAGDGFGGKTVLANWLVEQSYTNGLVDMAVFVNPKGHRFVRGTEVRSLRDLVETYRSGDRLFNYVPKTDTAAEHEQLIRTLRKVPGEKIVAHDEAHEVSESKMLDWAFRQGGNVGTGSRFKTGDIRSIAVTQHPWDLPESVAQNAPLLVWVGPKTPQTKRFFDSMQMGSAYEEIPDAPPYHWSVVDGGEYVETNAAVPEEYATA